MRLCGQLSFCFPFLFCFFFCVPISKHGAVVVVNFPIDAPDGLDPGAGMMVILSEIKSSLVGDRSFRQATRETGRVIGF